MIESRTDRKVGELAKSGKWAVPWRWPVFRPKARTNRGVVRTVFALLTLVLVCAPVFAQTAQDQTPEQKGLAIAREADLRDQGFADSTATMQMTLRNRHGEESLRQMRTKTLEQMDDGDKSLIVFDQPRDVKGTALLTYTHKAGSDDQWLYLPALKRVKRIASSNKSGPFMGSEFAYEDLSSQEVEKYTYKYLRDETFDGDEEHAGKTVFVIERFPVDEKSGYTRQLVWMDQDVLVFIHHFSDLGFPTITRSASSNEPRIFSGFS